MTRTSDVLARIEIYRQAAREREAGRNEALAARRADASSQARAAAKVLKRDFGATRVWLFGSLADSGVFHDRSDIDLAVEGIPTNDFWRAWAALDRLGAGLEIDLVDLRFASASLAAEIREHGVEL